MELKFDRKGIFMTISVFFLVMALLMIVGAVNSSLASKKTGLAQTTGIHQVDSIRSNIEWMAKGTLSASGFGYSIYNRSVIIEQNSSMGGALAHDLGAMKGFWSNPENGIILDFSDGAEVPVIYVRPANLTIRQEPTSASISVPENSEGSVLGYSISIVTECSQLSSEWINLSETESDPVSLTLYVECSGSSESISDLRNIDRHGFSELLIRDSGANLTIIRLSDPGSLEVQNLKSAHLNIMLPMNESVYYEMPSSLNIKKGDASYNGAIRIPG